MHDAKLIWITPDAEALIGKIARVSNPNNEDNPTYFKDLGVLKNSEFKSVIILYFDFITTFLTLFDSYYVLYVFSS